MAKKTTATKNKLPYRSSDSLPLLPNYKTSWDLFGLYYKDENDIKIEEDIKTAIKTYKGFARRWRNSNFTSNAGVLLSSLTDYEQISGNPTLSRPGRYFSLRLALNVTDTVADKALATIRKRLRVAGDEILFFTLELGKIPKAKQDVFLKDPALKHYNYFLKQVFIGAKHDLTEIEEKIIRLKSPQSSTLWQQMTEKLVSTAEIAWKGKNLPLPEALETIETLKSNDKPILWGRIIDKIDNFGIIAEHEFNAIISDVRMEDDLRKYKKPYSATALDYQHDEKSIEALVEAVSTEGFALSRKFYALKAKYLNVKQINYAQKYDTIGDAPKIDFSEALNVCRDVFYQVNTIYGQIFDDMLIKGQLDVFPKGGKQGGAFMSSQTGHPIQVLLNHSDTMKALETLAHEMGHAVHSARSSTQSPLYEGHSIVTAETASTLFENLVFNAIFSTADDFTKIVLLHDKITGDIATMQRQIAFFNCELEIHNTIHKEGAMTHDELKNCMHHHLTSYLGPAVNVTAKDGASYVYIPHLRYGFYVYSYTFGNLMSTIMANRYKENNFYREKIDVFLTLGESDNVVNIFKKIGIDTTKADTFSNALKNHANDISTLEMLISKNKPKLV